MTNFKLFACSLLLSGALLTSVPALAESQDERARAAIAEANAKIEAALQTKSSGESAALTAEAQASLRDAREQMGRDNEKNAITAAQKASDLADRALAAARTNEAQNAETQAATAAVAVAAQQDAAAANARATAAEQAAASAQADAAAARAAQPVVLAAPAPAATTITTQTETTGARTTSGSGTTTRKVVRKKTTARAATPVAAKTKTTTTVRTEN